MNLSIDHIPSHCDVLVVGAGPAGSAAAILLARRGLNIVLVDQRSFPRDKICGDGLIPDAQAALAQLGVLNEVLAKALVTDHATCVAPRGGRVDVPAKLAVLPRRLLDEIVCRAAVQAGAKMHAPALFDSPLYNAAGRVVGATLSNGSKRIEIRASWVVLATGAVSQALISAGVCERQTPTGVAIRGYVKNDAMMGRIKSLEVVWNRKLRGGYGWIFPCPDGVFNIGVGITESHPKGSNGRYTMQDVNLRKMFADFCGAYAPARELMATGAQQSSIKGAPLRFTLNGARYSRPGLLVTGEAAGSTYSFTGEGIGKALETGMLAARAIWGERAHGQSDEVARQAYEASLLALKPRFALYERANQVSSHPWLIDLVIWRARKSQGLVSRMSGVLNETSTPGNLMSLRGMTRLFSE